jgi:hypothetical protein
VLLVGGLIVPRSWALAAALVMVVVLGATLPARVRESGRILDAQRVANRGGFEQGARERCLLDMGRADLVEALAFAREQIPEDAHFALTTKSPSLACFTVNLLPREPVRPGGFDPARDWRILDQASPREVRRLAPTGGVVHSPSFVLVPPRSGADQ